MLAIMITNKDNFRKVLEPQNKQLTGIVSLPSTRHIPSTLCTFPHSILPELL